MAQPTLALREASIATQATAAPKQRMDIQGLRAIAVIAVIADHLFDYPTGGFVGVDIFFVISGFLITGLLLREHHRNGRIDFGGFYRRRVRRIIPVAVFVLAVTVGATYLTFSAARAGGVLADSLWSLGFATNWHFAIIGTDYWQSDGLVSPLQHFWSLAVEEQFYIVWPWLIILALTSRKRVLRGSRGLYVVMGLAAAVSFLYALWQTAEQPTWAYFSTFSRAWELAAGALIAVASPLLSKIRPWVAATIAWAGLGLILVSIFVVQPDSGFPAPGASLQL